jgi:hypothetical protein
MLAVNDVLMGAGFIRRLPPLLRHPVSPEEARATLRVRLERREADLLAMLRRVFDGPPGGPYRALLRMAGCEYGDLEGLVRHDGVEGTLQELFRRGVYLTVDELKGRRPIVRGSLTLEAGWHHVRNRAVAAHLPVQSSGSRGAATFMGLDLGFVRDLGVNIHLLLGACGGLGWQHAPWGVPGGSDLNRILTMAAAGIRRLDWFSQVDASDPTLHARYRWSIRALRWGGRVAGVPMPSPTYVPLEDPSPIVRWMASMLEGGRTPHVLTFASSAVRISQAAREMGVDLRGARFTMSGEPVTATRFAEVRRSGAEVLTRYGNSEVGGLVACGCLSPEAPDDFHLFRDLLALIQPGSNGPALGLPAGAVMVSSLRPSAPLILLNFCLGDQAEVSQRRCGCPFERLGWTTHLRAVRSFEKLTAGGVNLLDADVIRVLEDVLPTRFGGGPTDYQLVEIEAESGRPSLRLRVHPALGAIDETALTEAFLAEIARGSGIERVIGLAWKEGNLLKIERAVPEVTTGKVHHVHVISSPSADRHR